MKKLLLLVAIALISVPTNAQWGKRIRGNGDSKTIVHNVGDYDSVKIAGFFDTTLVKGTEGSIELTGESNLLDNIEVFVKNGTLTIKSKRLVELIPSRKTPILITIPVKDIDGMTLSGSGSITSKFRLESPKFKTVLSGSGDIYAAIDTTELDVTIAGSGDIELDVKASEIDVNISGSGETTLDGSTQSLDVNIAGSGDVHAYDLNAKIADINISGSADASVFVSERLQVRIAGSGDVHYKGNPKVDSRIIGSGDLIKN